MPEKIQKSDDLSSMTVFEAVELAQRLEARWGVSALVAGSAAGPDGDRLRWSKPPSARELVRQPVTDFRREAEIIGVVVAPEPDLPNAEAIVEKIAERSADLFPDQAAVRTFLFDNPIDGSGKTAVQLVQERGATALLIKLDQMRFGANG